jgi:hypothetical protein
MTLPMVSCLMPTFGRAARQPHLLQEAVYWWTRQDYAGPTELVILNDHAGQTLTCSVPGVRVVNLTRRLPSLGAKCNALLALAHGTVGMMFEDDDIALPHRVRQSVERLGHFDYWNPRGQWYEDAGVLHTTHAQGVCHNASAFRIDALRGRYPVLTRAHDAIVDSWACSNLRCANDPLPLPAEWSYIYRWSVSDYHLSGVPDMEAGYRDAPGGAAGRFEVTPRRGRDYAADCAAAAG